MGKISDTLRHYRDVAYNKYYLPQILFRNKQRRRLKNRVFSLLTGNCMGGGYIYHQLGLRFTSPTINMMIVNQDFYKLVMNLDYYMSLSPTPYIDPAFPNVPSGLLGDIVLHFTHYHTCEEGISAWNQRKMRIDYNNLYVIFHDMDLSPEEIKNLGNVKCKKIVVMTATDYGYDHCLYIPAFEGQEHVGNLLAKTLSGKWLFEKYFDFVGWVNSDDPVARHFYIN